MTHHMLLALFVLSGVFTAEELAQFLKDKEKEQVPYQADWQWYMNEVNLWKAHQKGEK